MMDKDKQPGISFDSIMLVKEIFWRDHYVPIKSEVLLEIGHNWDRKDDKYTSELQVFLKLVSEDKVVLKLESTFIGVFTVIEGEQNMEIKDYINKMSPALMFPYIREHVSSITQKAGIKPIYLPPVNVLALMKDSDES
jgi:preprotein translocase subunit SecB